MDIASEDVDKAVRVLSWVEEEWGKPLSEWRYRFDGLVEPWVEEFWSLEFERVASVASWAFDWHREDQVPKSRVPSRTAWTVRGWIELLGAPDHDGFSEVAEAAEDALGWDRSRSLALGMLRGDQPLGGRSVEALAQETGLDEIGPYDMTSDLALSYERWLETSDRPPDCGWPLSETATVFDAWIGSGGARALDDAFRVYAWSREQGIYDIDAGEVLELWLAGASPSEVEEKASELAAGRQTQRGEDAKFLEKHGGFFRAHVQSRDVTFEGGDGRSKDDAVRVTRTPSREALVRAERRYISEALGHMEDWELVEQALLSGAEDEWIDRLTVRLEDGGTREFHFDLSEVWGNLDSVRSGSTRPDAGPGGPKETTDQEPRISPPWR